MKTNSVSTMYNKAFPYLAAVFLQLGFSGLGIIAKFSLNGGMSHYTFAVYRNLVAGLFFAPFAFFCERKLRPTMTMSVFLKIMLLGLLEPVIDQNLFYSGMKYTTASFASAMTNITPAITFIMAWIFGFEKVNLKRIQTLAKIVGTMVTIGGATIMTLVKGGALGLPWTKVKNHVENLSTNSNSLDPIKGAIMISTGCFCWGGFYILQASTLKLYPAGLSLTTLVCLMGSLQGVILTFIMEKGDMSVWSFKWDMKLLSAVYGGLVCSGLSYYIQGLIMLRKGPVFVTAFNPLYTVMVAMMGSIFLSEQLYVGRMVGAVIIVIGLYFVLWGKSKDENTSKLDTDQISPIDQETNSDEKSQNDASRDKGFRCSTIITNDEGIV